MKELEDNKNGGNLKKVHKTRLGGMSCGGRKEGLDVERVGNMNRSSGEMEVREG